MGLVIRQEVDFAIAQQLLMAAKIALRMDPAIQNLHYATIKVAQVCYFANKYISLKSNY